MKTILINAEFKAKRLKKKSAEQEVHVRDPRPNRPLIGHDGL